MKVLIIIIATLMSLTQLYSQPENLESNYSRYTAFAVDDDNFYIGLENGFVVQDRKTSEYKYYSSLNTDMLSNNINEIEVYKGKVYFLSQGDIYIYSDDNIKLFDLENSNITGIFKDKNDFLWFNGEDFLKRYDGMSFKEIDITKQVEEYGKLESFVFDNNYIWLTFGSSNSRFRYALYDLTNDTMRTFTKEERGFDQESRAFLTFLNGNVWIRSNQRIYNYNIISGLWQIVDTFKLPKDMVITSHIVSDNEGKMWFTVTETEIDTAYIANYDGVSDSINVLYDHKFDKDLYPFRFHTFGDNILLTMENSYNLINNNNVNEIIKFDEDYRFLKSSNFYGNNSDGIFLLANVYQDSTTTRKFLNLLNKETSPYKLSEYKYFPLSNIGSYFFIDDMELISGSYNSIDYVNKDGSWKGTSSIGIEKDNRVLVKIDNNNNYYFYDKGIYKYENGTSEKKFNYSAEMQRGVEIHDDKAFFYSSFPVGDHFIDFNLTRFYGVKVDVLDMSGKVNRTLNDSNSCMSQWFEHGKVSIYYYGAVPSDLKVDNKGNIWCLTWKSLYYIDENVICSRFKFDEEGGNPKPSNIAYSKFQGKMYGRKDNIIYDLSDTNYRIANSEEMVDGELDFIGECNDGLVYVATTDGRLFRLNTIDNWEKIPLIYGKDKIHVNIRNVFRYEDTLYVSTGIGLIKVHQELTSVESKDYVKDFKIYPNPSQDFINIDPIYINENIEIRTLTGKLVLESKGTEIIDVNELNAGLYIVKCGDKITKFIKD